MLTKECIYLLLEVENVRQNHRLIPITFIYPLAGMAFTCCSYTKVGKVVYNASKKKIHDPWDVTFSNKAFSKKTGFSSKCLFDTLENTFRFVENTPSADVEADIGIWHAKGTAKNVLMNIKEYSFDRDPSSSEPSRILL